MLTANGQVLVLITSQVIFGRLQGGSTAGFVVPGGTGGRPRCQSLCLSSAGTIFKHTTVSDNSCFCEIYVRRAAARHVLDRQVAQQAGVIGELVSQLGGLRDLRSGAQAGLGHRKTIRQVRMQIWTE